MFKSIQPLVFLACCNVVLYFFYLCTIWICAHIIRLFQKKSKKDREEDILFWNTSTVVFIFVILNSEFLEKTSFHHWKFCKVVWHLLQFQDQKPRSMEIPQEFFWTTPENFTSFLFDPWNFYILFIQFPWKLHTLNSS